MEKLNKNETATISIERYDDLKQKEQLLESFKKEGFLFFRNGNGFFSEQIVSLNKEKLDEKISLIIENKNYEIKRLKNQLEEQKKKKSIKHRLLSLICKCKD